jgi:hypothetical protein
LISLDLPVSEELGEPHDGLKGRGLLEREPLPGGGEDAVGLDVEATDQRLGLVVVEGAEADPEFGLGFAFLEGAEGSDRTGRDHWKP